MNSIVNDRLAADIFETLLEVRFPAQADRIKLIRPSIEAAARMCGLLPAPARDVVLAVDEACQNIIIHAYKDREGGDIALTLIHDGMGILVELRDNAPRIDPKLIRHRALNDIKPGKLGTFLMGTIMDRVEYLPCPRGGNLLRMYKRKDGSI